MHFSHFRMAGVRSHMRLRGPQLLECICIGKKQREGQLCSHNVYFSEIGFPQNRKI